MAFHQTQNFIEKLRLLRCPRAVTQASFAVPNFELMADLLVWLTKCYDPTIDLVKASATEAERVAFVRQAVTVLASKTPFRLNTRRLYLADTQCIGELAQIAHVLYAASRTTLQGDAERWEQTLQELSPSAVDACRQRVREATELGASLHELLGAESQLKDRRQAAAAQAFELGAVDEAVAEALQYLRSAIEQLQQGAADATRDQAHLREKVDKQRREEARLQKRLETLQSVRPAHQDEYDKLEAELVSDYNVYVEHFRNMVYLEAQLEKLQDDERQRHDETEKRLRDTQDQMQETEKQLLRNDSELGLLDLPAVASLQLAPPDGARLASDASLDSDLASRTPSDASRADLASRGDLAASDEDLLLEDVDGIPRGTSGSGGLRLGGSSRGGSSEVVGRGGFSGGDVSGGDFANGGDGDDDDF